MTAEITGRKAITIINSIVNLMVLTIIMMVTAFAGYALWDSKQIYQAADKSQYAVYKPQAADGGKSFKELQAINDEVFAWLSVYGTNIDYPVTQGPDNMKYVNTNAEGLYSLSGAIFLDYQNSRNFSDFNSILFGHHMEKKTMFGEIGDFSDKNMFDTHLYGNLYYDELDHGIEFFAFIHTDAYDHAVFTSNVSSDREQEYLDGLLRKAMYSRDIDITIEDRIILLSTCSSDSTNGRDILIGRLTDEVFEDPFTGTDTDNMKEQLNVDSLSGRLQSILPWLMTPILILLLILVLRSASRKRARSEANNRRKGGIKQI